MGGVLNEEREQPQEDLGRSTPAGRTGSAKSPMQEERAPLVLGGKGGQASPGL